jgi:hypothetical protein
MTGKTVDDLTKMLQLYLTWKRSVGTLVEEEFEEGEGDEQGGDDLLAV